MVDWGVLYVLTSVCEIYHLISAVVSFIAGLLTNFILSKLLVFKANEAKVNSLTEFLGYALIGVVGLGLTELIMYVGTDCFGLYYMIPKVLATVIVLIWNYFARKKLLYK